MLSRSTCAAFLLAAAPALANPTSPTVVAGSATFNTAGSTLTVTNSSGAIINWQGFSIGAGETTRFQQPSSSSTVLNRVTGAGASQLNGVLDSNGKVFLVNPNGVLFGPGSQVNVAGLIATTLDIANADFLAGNLNFVSAGTGGVLISQGTISAGPQGSVSLFSPQVTIGGSISAGQINVALGNEVTLTSFANTTGLEVVQASSGFLTVEEGTTLNGNFVITTSAAVIIQGSTLVPGGRFLPVVPNVPELGGGSAITGFPAMTGSPGVVTLASPAQPPNSPAVGLTLNLLKREVSF